jgi:hypothetical protein
MTEQVVTTLLGTILGGVLAIVGGFVASLFSQRLARDEEKRTVIREKSEKIYKLANHAADWSAEQRAIVVARSRGKDTGTGTPFESEHRSGDIVMLVRLYIPALARDAEALRGSADALALLCEKVDEGRSAGEQDAKQAVELDEAIAGASKRLRSKLEALIQF